MKVDMNIDIHHIARVEGHGNIHIKVKNGKLLESTWEVVETPRFFEAILKGKSHDLAPVLTSRICGICSISHTLVSIRAVERAMNIPLPEPAKLLRILAKHGETIQSHFLHLFFLVAPDFFDVDSVIPITKSHPEVAQIAVRLKKLGNDICDIISGRTTHPVSLIIGGISKAPEKKKLEKVKQAIIDRLDDVKAAVDLFKTLTIPEFVRETEFVSLKGDTDYPWIGGNLVSTDSVEKVEDDYLAMTNEYKKDYSTSKLAILSREAFAVGALARFNNNYKFLCQQAKEVSWNFGLQPVNHNPYANNIAQLVEAYHVMLESITIIDTLLAMDLSNIKNEYEIKAGEGVGAVEAPRGILYHHYQIDDKGKIVKANCIIPTTQNHANIYLDLQDLVKQQVEKGAADKETAKLCEMLVRAYDPCISCSVH